MDYKLNGTKEKYFEGKNHANVTEESEVVMADVMLEKDPGFSLVALITDNKTKAPLEGVTMKIKNSDGGTTNFVTPAGGDYRTPLAGKKLGDKINYTIELSKPGYLSKIIEFQKLLDKPGEVRVQTKWT